MNGSKIAIGSVSNLSKSGTSAYSLVVSENSAILLGVTAILLLVTAFAIIWYLVRARALHDTALNKANADLEHQMEEVRALSEELSRTNDALEDALIESERTAARATALQELTAALSLANATSDIAAVLRTHGLRAMQAMRSHLVLVEGNRIVPVDVDGSPDDPELTVRYASGDETLPLVRAIHDRQTVWLRSAKEYDACFPHGGSGGAAMPIDAHLALALIHAGEVVGGLAFDFAICPAILATDNLFTTLLAQATADALVRARSYDQERQARRNAEMLSQAREDVLGVVAHDLRNPLNLVSMTSQLLMEPDLAPERRQSAYAISSRAVQRMNRLIGDLLDVVRMEAGHLSLNLAPFAVSEVLEETMEAFQQRAAEQGIALVLSMGENATIQADEERIVQLLDNLVGNALKFTPSGGRVTVDSRVEAGEECITVSDTGPGIPQEQLARLFDRFWQARGNDRRGLGLGLPIAKGIAEAHGGRLWVESTVGSGTAFHFAMPISVQLPSAVDRESVNVYQYANDGLNHTDDQQRDIMPPFPEPSPQKGNDYR